MSADSPGSRFKSHSRNLKYSIIIPRPFKSIHAVKNDTENNGTGYAVIYFAGDEDNKTYTQQIPVDTDFDFTVHANGSNALVIEIQWGTCALDGVNKLADQGVIGTVTAP